MLLWYVVVFFAGVAVGGWLVAAYQSWRKERPRILRRRAKRHNPMRHK